MLEYLITSLYLIIFLVIIIKVKFFQIAGIKKKYIIGTFLLKLLSGVFLSLIYTYYYTDRATADIYKYYDSSAVMFNSLFYAPMDFVKMITGIGDDSIHFRQYYENMDWYREYENSLYNNSHTIIRINAIFRLFSFGNFYVHTIFMCFIAFSGLIAIFKTFEKYINDQKLLFFFSLFLMPSIILWSSSILKESIIIFCYGFILYILITKKISKKNILYILILVYLLLLTKALILFTLIPSFIAFFIVKKIDKWHWQIYLFINLLFILITTNVYRIIPEYDLLELLFMKQRDFFGLAHYSNSGSLIPLKQLKPTFISVLSVIPNGLFNVLFRPFINDYKNVLILFAGIENFILVLSMIISIIFCKIKKLHLNILLFLCSFVIVNYVIIGITTPVMGAIVRYKMLFLPFFIVILLMITDFKKIKDTIYKH
ncbi:MAG: hypothetical protein A2X12_09675 [Bacteroidetes bacterium GWE2_29_8]|nr:MAG: hypothetical protein A2X12_09675 [Bacteroidetes bacterium GWE2_29_8]OFY15356.1 MAG: hypothetical protein A2X02_02875 [Bacteroidetes bacterium GWF2_29_10]